MNTDEKQKDLFSGICKEKNHKMKLEYFCKTHNELCCPCCLCTIKTGGNGKHKDCDTCTLKKIKNVKKNKIKENIKYLEKLSETIEQSINDLKNIFKIINENRDNLKLKIQKIFTLIRNELNNRENALLIEIDKKFEEIYFKEDLIQKSEKLPKKINESIKKGKIEENDWNNKNKLSNLINTCIIIEKNTSDINCLNNSIKKCNSLNELNVKFTPEEKEIEEFIKLIQNFGKIYCKNIVKKQDYYNEENNVKDKKVLIKQEKEINNKNEDANKNKGIENANTKEIKEENQNINEKKVVEIANKTIQKEFIGNKEILDKTNNKKNDEININNNTYVDIIKEDNKEINKDKVNVETDEKNVIIKKEENKETNTNINTNTHIKNTIIENDKEVNDVLNKNTIKNNESLFLKEINKKISTSPTDNNKIYIDDLNQIKDIINVCHIKYQDVTNKKVEYPNIDNIKIDLNSLRDKIVNLSDCFNEYEKKLNKQLIRNENIDVKKPYVYDDINIIEDNINNINNQLYNLYIKHIDNNVMILKLIILRNILKVLFSVYLKILLK